MDQDPEIAQLLRHLMGRCDEPGDDARLDVDHEVLPTSARVLMASPDTMIHVKTEPSRSGRAEEIRPLPPRCSYSSGKDTVMAGAVAIEL